MKSIFIKTLALTLSIVMLISLALFGFESYANENALSAPINSESSSSDKSNTNNASNHLIVFANGEYKVNFICSATATDLDKSVCNQLCLLFSKATGVMPTVKTDAARISGPAILIGKTTNEKSTELYSSVSTNQAKAALSKDFYAIAYSNEESFLELYEKLRALISRQLEGNTLVIDSNWNLSLRHVNTAKASISLPNKVIALDQRYQKAVIYNLNNYSAGKTLDDLEESSFTVGHAAGIKYRENTVFGNVIIEGYLVCCLFPNCYEFFAVSIHCAEVAIGDNVIGISCGSPTDEVVTILNGIFCRSFDGSTEFCGIGNCLVTVGECCAFACIE
jgi:hypothetical protein